MKRNLILIGLVGAPLLAILGFLAEFLDFIGHEPPIGMSGGSIHVKSKAAWSPVSQAGLTGYSTVTLNDFSLRFEGIHGMSAPDPADAAKGWAMRVTSRTKLSEPKNVIWVCTNKECDPVHYPIDPEKRLYFLASGTGTWFVNSNEIRFHDSDCPANSHGENSTCDHFVQLTLTTQNANSQVGKCRLLWIFGGVCKVKIGTDVN